MNLAIRNNIPSNIYPVNLCCVKLSAWIRLQTKLKLFALVAYIPPDAAFSKINHLSKLVEKINKSMHDNYNTLLVRDFYFSNIQWERVKTNENHSNYHLYMIILKFVGNVVMNLF